MRAQPSRELEEENAFYHLSKECLAEHIAECRKAAEYISDRQMEEIAWTYDRFRAAFDRHKELKNKRIGK